MTEISTNSLYLTKLYVTYVETKELCKNIISHIWRNPPKFSNSAHIFPRSRGGGEVVLYGALALFFAKIAHSKLSDWQK